MDFSNLRVQEHRLKEHIASLDADSRSLVLEALKLAKHAHEKQLRDEGAPYIIHPIRACLSLIELQKVTTDRMVAILLHDVVEDTGISLEHIREHFGRRVAKLVKNLTRERPLHENEDDKRQSKIKKLKSYLAADYDTRLLKCLDVLDNVRSWSNIPASHPSRKKFGRWYDEVEKYSLPIAEKTEKVLASLLREAFQKAQSKNLETQRRS